MREVAEEEADAREIVARLEPLATPEPELPDWLHWIWRAWWRLHHDRPWRAGGMGPAQPGRIPWSVVAAWCDRHGYGPEDEHLLEAGLAAMDAEWLAWHDEQQRRAAKR